MFLGLLFVAVVISCCYGVSKLISGAAAMSVFSLVACAFFTWNYLSIEPLQGYINVFEQTSNTLGKLSLPAAIVTFTVAILSGIYFLIERKVKVEP